MTRPRNKNEVQNGQTPEEAKKPGAKNDAREDFKKSCAERGSGFDPQEGVAAARARLARALGLPYGEQPRAVHWMEDAQEKAARAALFGSANKTSDVMRGQTTDDGDAMIERNEKGAGNAGSEGDERNEGKEGNKGNEGSPSRDEARGPVAAEAAPAPQQALRSREIFASEDVTAPDAEEASLRFAAGGRFGAAGGEAASSAAQAFLEPRAARGAFDLRGGLDSLEGAQAGLSPLERLRRMSERLRSFARARRERDELSKVKGQREETRRQRMTLAGVLAALVAVAALLVWVSETTREPRKPEVRTYRNDFRLAPDSLDKQSFQRQYEEKLETLTLRLKSMETTMTQMDARMKNLAKDGRAADGAAADVDARLKRLSGEARIPIAQLPAAASVGELTGADGARLAAQADVLTSLQVAGAGAAAGENRMGVVKVAAAEKKTERVARAPRRVGDAPIAANRARHEPERTYLPAGSFARARVLSGVTAPTGGNAAQNPMPLLLEVTHFAQLPNDFKANVRRCFVTANATGDISSERVLVRLDRLSCMNRQGKAVDVRVQGYVTGEDGKAGVRARLVTRSGQAIASALFTGAISGLGKAVSLSAQRTTTYTSGAVGSSVDNAWAAGIGEGVDSAMDRIVNYYLKLADKIFPVLELDSGREVDVVLAQGLSISFDPPKPEEVDATNSSLVFGENMRARREKP